MWYIPTELITYEKYSAEILMEKWYEEENHLKAQLKVEKESAERKKW
jgi:hypothetical protein